MQTPIGFVFHISNEKTEAHRYFVACPKSPGFVGLLRRLEIMSVKHIVHDLHIVEV